MTGNMIDLVSYTFATAFTPGPNNIVALASVMALGLRRSVPFLLGIGVGMSVTMLVTGALTSWLLLSFPAVLVLLRGAGFIYLVWLAYKIATSSRFDEDNRTSGYGFIGGFVLQVINAKIILFTITAISAFVIPAGSGLLFILGACLITAMIACLGTLTWAVAGAFLKKAYLNYFRTVNISMAVVLIYFACKMIV
ncbi:LysE family transporter [Serratia marcescens]|uniref:LysE family transporter n=1 Tax=Serratia marcescens TaxID=615 RepID=UPI000E1E290B|nr:LysE family transporter [Serratia marcescens]AXK22894.1 Hypothetical protein SmN45_1089 [Serratia marcescens]MBL0876368.1 LysE family transporter [Serratia nevei]QXX97742.1 LysE family transporter [Serratia marcescens]